MKKFLEQNEVDFAEKSKEISSENKDDDLIEEINEISPNSYEIKTNFLGHETIEVIKPQKIELDEEDGAKKFIVTEKLLFKCPNGKFFDFKQFLPSDAYFIKAFYNDKNFLGVEKNLPEDENLGLCWFFDNAEDSDYSEGTALVCYNSFTRVGDRLTLLHELGHVANRGRFVGKIQDKISLLGESQIRAQSKSRRECKKGEMLVHLFDDSGKEVPTPLPQSAYLGYSKMRAADERNAWSFALRQLRKLRKQGIDLEPELDDFQKIDEIVNDALMSYQKDFSHRVFSKEVYNKLFKNIFCKKEEALKQKN